MDKTSLLSRKSTSDTLWRIWLRSMKIKQNWAPPSPTTFFTHLRKTQGRTVWLWKFSGHLCISLELALAFLQTVANVVEWFEQSHGSRHDSLLPQICSKTLRKWDQPCPKQYDSKKLLWELSMLIREKNKKGSTRIPLLRCDLLTPIFQNNLKKSPISR
jgi:hypothetical protein